MRKQQQKTSKKGAARPMALLILDGWGYSETPQHNAIAAANKPVWDRLWNNYPHTLIRTSGAAVGSAGLAHAAAATPAAANAETRINSRRLILSTEFLLEYRTDTRLKPRLYPSERQSLIAASFLHSSAC